MIELKQYQCEICKTVYKDREKCWKCESSHKKIVTVVLTTYKPYKDENNTGFYPSKISVTFSDGNSIFYRPDV